VNAFLFYEAALVDDRRFEEWLGLFAEHASYEVPLRVTRDGHVSSELSERGRIFSDSRQTLGIRVQRLLSEYAWAEQPPSRTRHHVSNVRVAGGPDGTFDVAANVLVYRNRGDDPRHDLYSAARRDLLEPASGSYRILRRWLAVDQSNLTGNSLSVFL
jgi:3-phenylpropionate/cinnamic acid dioxygenase small subunit